MQQKENVGNVTENSFWEKRGIGNVCKSKHAKIIKPAAAILKTKVLKLTFCNCFTNSTISIGKCKE